MSTINYKHKLKELAYKVSQLTIREDFDEAYSHLSVAMQNRNSTKEYRDRYQKMIAWWHEWGEGFEISTGYFEVDDSVNGFMAYVPILSNHIMCDSEAMCFFFNSKGEIDSIDFGRP